MALSHQNPPLYSKPYFQINILLAQYLHNNSVVNVIQIANLYLFGIDSKVPSVHCKAINDAAVG